MGEAFAGAKWLTVENPGAEAGNGVGLAPAAVRGDDADAVGQKGRIGGPDRRPGERQVVGRAAGDIAPHVGDLEGLVAQGDVGAGQQRADVDRAPVDMDTSFGGEAGDALDRKAGVGAAEDVEEIEGGRGGAAREACGVGQA